MVPEVLGPALQQEGLTGTPCSVEAYAEGRSLVSHEDSQLVGEFFPVKDVVRPRVLLIYLLFQEFELRQWSGLGSLPKLTTPLLAECPC